MDQNQLGNQFLLKYLVPHVNKVKHVLQGLLFVFFISFFFKAAFPAFFNKIFYTSFIASLVILLILIITEKKWKDYKNFIIVFWPYLILILFFLLSVIRTPELYVIKEFFKGFVVLILILCSIIVINKVPDFKNLEQWFKVVTIWITVILSTLCLILTINYSSILTQLGIKGRFSLANDYNMFALVLLMGIVTMVFQMTKKLSVFLQILYCWAIFTISVNILFSESRRGIFSIAAFFLLAIIMAIGKPLIKNQKLSNIIKNLRSLFVLLIVSIMLSWISIFNLSPQLKHYIFYINGYNGNLKEKLTYPLSRYSRSNYQIFYNGLWYNEFPDYLKFLNIPKLQKFNNNFLPNANYAYLPKSNKLNIIPWHDGQLFSKKLGENIIYGCQSFSFNDGLSVELDVPKYQNIELQVLIKVIQKGKDFRVMTLANDRYIIADWPLNLKPGDTVTMKLHAKYAHNDVPRIFIIGGSTNNPSKFVILDAEAKIQGKKSDIISKNILSDEFIDSIFVISNPAIYSDSEINSNAKKPEIIDSETYSTVNGDRLNYLKHAYTIWKDKYTSFEKLLGNGFVYLHDFGEHFHSNQQRIDYPHNPIASAFLYSGLIGGIFYLFFLGYSLFLYFKYRSILRYFIVLYLITLFFMIFSGNSHFSAPFFTILSIIPFCIKYIYRSEDCRIEN
jgi:hypothetical protein